MQTVHLFPNIYFRTLSVWYETKHVLRLIFIPLIIRTVFPLTNKTLSTQKTSKNICLWNKTYFLTYLNLISIFRIVNHSEKIFKSCCKYFPSEIFWHHLITKRCFNTSWIFNKTVTKILCMKYKSVSFGLKKSNHASRQQ